jgi:hypothetical protein
MVRKTTSAILVGVWLLAAGIGQAQSFKILDITPNLTGLNVDFFQFHVAMNGNGVAAFSGLDLTTTATRSVVYASDGVSTWEAFSGLTATAGELMVGSINDSNTIAVKKHVFNGPESIGVLTGGSVQIISPNVQSVGLPAINNSGDVVYVKLTTHFVESATINLVKAGISSEIAKVDYNPILGLWLSEPTLNDAGKIAAGITLSLPQGNFSTIAVWENGTRSFPVLEVPPSYANYPAIAINTPGDIAYVVERPQDRFSLEVLHANSTISSLLDAGPGQQFRDFGDVGIADNGDVAVLAYDAVGKSTLMLHRDGQFLPIVSRGDSLFGSTVTGVFYSGAVSNHGQVAFSYLLADGRNGFAMAEPVPEPTAATIAASLLFPFALFVRLRRRGLRLETTDLR